MKQTEKFFFFWKGPLSQWHRCMFTVDNVSYNCAEQYMMAKKAELFGDLKSLERIMSSNSPREQKALGRKVKNFEPKIWNSQAKNHVLKANTAKFSQNPDLKRFLLDTKGLIVEASPLDTIWGIGLDEDDPRALDRAQWKGTNWLGEVLTKVRTALCDSDLQESR
ncbi:MAG: NADAR family protein [Candidatus Xenobiia bacterium LiM19]